MKESLKMKNRKYLRNENPILNLYKVNPNYYHTYVHYLDCMSKFKKFCSKLNIEFNQILPDTVGPGKNILWYSDFFNTVFLWHDSVYIPTNLNNEKLSALEYKRFITKIQGKDFVNFDVVEAIESTAYNFDIESIPETTDSEKQFKFFCKVIHDIDWSGFISYEECVKNERKIINEALAFTKFSKQDIQYKRLTFYETILKENKDIFLTNTFAEYNDIARKNIELRIKHLKKVLKIK